MYEIKMSKMHQSAHTIFGQSTYAVPTTCSTAESGQSTHAVPITESGMW